jgi:TfoX/Sxy family transcriptional regulator of competence genes
MAYDLDLADRIRLYLTEFYRLKVEEKRMFGGLAFLINGKMCVNVSGEKLMCRFDPARTEELSKKKGYQPMIMRGKKLEGYCYISSEGFKSKKDFEYWVNLCLEFNKQAKASKK